MKKLLVLLFSILISFNSYGEWIRITENTSGSSFYLDLDTIKQHNGYVYWWLLSDYLKPIDGDMSTELYIQTDCAIAREKHLSFNSYDKPMGSGSKTSSFTPPDKWHYPTLGSVGRIKLDYICKYID